MARRRSSAPTPGAAFTAEQRILVLAGPEEMLKRQCLDDFRAALHKVHGDFDSIVFDGAEASLADVLDEVRTYSLLQPFKMVILDAADEFLRRENHREALERYAERPVDHAALVLRSGGWRPGRIDKLIQKVGRIQICDPLPRADAAPWVIRRCASAHGREIDPAAAAALVDRVGASLLRLDSELAKLAALAPAGQTIAVSDVDELVGRSSDEKAWAIQAALLEAIGHGDRPAVGTGNGRGRKLLEKVHELVDLAGNDTVPVAWAVGDLMRKLCYAALLQRRGVPDGQVARQLNLWGDARDAIPAAARKVDAGRARLWFDRMMELEWRNRNGLGEPIRNLECFCALLVDEI